MLIRGQATFLPGDPPRSGVLAVAQGDPTAEGSVDLVVPTPNGPQRRTVGATLHPLNAVLPRLLDATPASETLRFFAAAATWALTLVARGRLVPAVTDGGRDAWRIGPLDPEDAERFAALVAACPPEAHAIAVPGTRPLRMRSAESVVRAFCDAVADTMARTAAASVTTQHPAFASTGSTDVTQLKPWLDDSGRGLAGARAGLRIDGDDERLTAVLQLRSRNDPALVVDAADLWAAPAVVLEKLGGGAETDLLLALRRGARAWPPLATVLDTPAPTHLDLDDDAIADLLGEGAEALGNAGLEVLWPKDLLSDGVTVRAVATALPGDGAAGFSLDTLLRFRWEATLDGEPLTEDELRQLAEATRPLIRLRGRWIKVDAALLERLRRRRPQQLTGMEALAAALTGSIAVDDEVVEFQVSGALSDLAGRLGALAEAREHDTLAPPAGLTATLRPYQLRGLRWLAEMTDLGLGGCLADDMGLGKTVQLIALHLLRHERAPGEGPTLVVCPTSLLGNWEREINRFAPGVPVRRFHGGDRHLDALANDEIVLATYGMVRRDRPALAEVPWGLVVADEAQHVKNPLSRGARELRAIPATARVALTGTPVENRLTDLYAILDWTTPGLLGPLDRFRRTVAVPVERYRDAETTERLARVVRPFLLRRRKSDPGIAPELPAKIETDRVVPLSAEQATLYETVVKEALDTIAAKAGIERRGLVLKLLTELKQICNHPAQYLHQDGPLEGRSGKLAALDELTDVIVDEGDSVLVFSQYVTMCRLLEAHLTERGVATVFLHGGVPARKREEMVARFQGGGVPVFLLSLKAGGTGLNLTRATHVIHYDRWWNPAVEDQATDRAHRIGQDRAVQVHRLMAEGTLEDRIAELMDRKRALAESVVGAGEAWLSELTDAELAELVTLT
jgi:superfamily II DNA or RNA helicase